MKYIAFLPTLLLCCLLGAGSYKPVENHSETISNSSSTYSPTKVPNVRDKLSFDGNPKKEAYIESGSYGSVYRVVKEDNTRWAAKILSGFDKIPEETSKALKTLRQEAKRLLLLKDSGLVPEVLGIGQLEIDNEEHDALIMELGEKSLAQCIEERSDDVSLRAIESFVDKIPHFVQLLKQNYIDYSDIDPGNLLLMKDGSIKCIDINAGYKEHYRGSFGEKMAKSLVETINHECYHLQYQSLYKDHEYQRIIKYTAPIFYHRLTGKKAPKITSIDELFKSLPIKYIVDFLKNDDAFNEDNDSLLKEEEYIAKCFLDFAIFKNIEEETISYEYITDYDKDNPLSFGKHQLLGDFLQFFPGLNRETWESKIRAINPDKSKDHYKKYLGVETLDEYLGKIFEQALEMAFADEPQHTLKQKLKDLYYNY